MLPEPSIYRFLHSARARPSPPELFADLFQATERRFLAPGRDPGATAGLAAKVRGQMQREDAYRASSKPPCDRADRAIREQLVDALVRDANRVYFAPAR